MNRDDIIRIATETELWEQRQGVWMAIGGEADLVRFAAAIRAQARAEALEEAAKVCESAVEKVSPASIIGDDVREAGLACCQNLAAAIRALAAQPKEGE